MKVRTLTLKDFQAHAKTRVEFSPGVTTIVGPTDKGKSAILRALRWTALNDIPGEEFIREGARQATAILEIMAGKKRVKITRSKGKDGNTYSIDGKEHKAFGQGVPADIAAVLQLNEINFQGQHDSPFWFSETGGNVSRKLNAVIDLSVIDSSLEYAAAQVRTAQETENVCKTRLRDSSLQWEDKKGQAARVEEFAALEKSREQLETAETELNELATLFRAAANSKAKALAERASEAKSLLAFMLVASEWQRSCASLRELCTEIEATADRCTPPPPFKPVQEQYQQWADAQESHASLSRLTQAARAKASAITTLTTAAKAAEAKFHAQTKGRVCPLCKNLFLSQ